MGGLSYAVNFYTNEKRPRIMFKNNSRYIVFNDADDEDGACFSFDSRVTYLPIYSFQEDHLKPQLEVNNNGIETDAAASQTVVNNTKTSRTVSNSSLFPSSSSCSSLSTNKSSTFSMFDYQSNNSSSSAVIKEEDEESCSKHNSSNYIVSKKKISSNPSPYSNNNNNNNLTPNNNSSHISSNRNTNNTTRNAIDIKNSRYFKELMVLSSNKYASNMYDYEKNINEEAKPLMSLYADYEEEKEEDRDDESIENDYSDQDEEYEGNIFSGEKGSYRNLDSLHLKKVYCCSNCFMQITTPYHILSEDYRGKTGKAYLLERMVNVKLGPEETTQMITGSYLCCDVYCSGCGNYIGWKYLKSFDVEMNYKNGLYIVELKQVLQIYV